MSKNTGRRKDKAPPGDRGIGFISQVTDPGAKKWSGDCGAASLHMQLQPFGFVDNKTVDELQSAMGPCLGQAEHNLSGWDEIVCVGNSLGANMSTGTGTLRHGDIALIDYSFISNRVDKGYGGWHWLCMVADWGDTYACNDPDSVGSGSKGIQYSKAEFDAAYVACGTRYVRCHNLDAGAMVVNADSGVLRLRDKPDVNNSKVLIEIPNGTVVAAKNLQGYFYEIEYQGQKGYGHAAYLFWNKGQVVAQPSSDYVDMYVLPDTGGLNFRTGPSVDNESLAKLDDLTVVKAKPPRNGWCEVLLSDGRKGFCSAQYLAEGLPKK
jgi:hypothetical protein